MIYKKEPQNFHSKVDVVGCFVECDEKILLLHRQNHKPEGNTWGIPAGKVNNGEKILNTMVREIQEETGFRLSSLQLSYFKKVYIKFPEYNIIFHIFQIKLSKKQKVIVNHQEHKNFKWVSPKNALCMPLIQDLDTCIKLFYKL